jgi:hypothetical protein
MTFWCIYRSPLMIGGNMPENRDMELQLFTNEEVLNVNQQGINPRQLSKTDSTAIWVSNVPESKDMYVAVFNTATNAADQKVDFKQLGIRGKAAIRDLWKKTDLGVFSKSYQQKVNGHGALLLRVTLK